MTGPKPPSAESQQLERDQFAAQYAEFVRLGATHFRGTCSATAAARWLEQCEYAFEKMKLSSVERVKLAATQLHSYAQDWWCSVKESLDTNTLKWGTFRTYFQEE